MELNKEYPNCVEIEEIVLGGVLLNSNSLFEISLLQPEHFYLEAHKVIFESVLSLQNSNKSINIITVSQYLRDKKKLDYVGGAAYISGLTFKVCSTANILEHSKQIIEKFLQRQLIVSSQEIIYKCYENYELDKLIDISQEYFGKVSKAFNSNKTTVNICDTVNECLADFDSRVIATQNGQVLGISSGIDEFTKHLRGWTKTDLIILAARPGMGKTAVSLFFAKNAAKAGFHTRFYSLEMSRIQLVDRLISSEFKTIDVENYQRGLVHQNDYQELEIAANTIANLHTLKIIDNLFSLSEIIIDLTIAKKNNECDFAIIDYIQLMDSNNKGTKNEDVAFITTSLKKTAKKLDIPIIALSQLNRTLETRGDKHPQLSDLRDSGAIEQDADIVIFLYRQNEYDKKIIDLAADRTIEFDIAKFRNGSKRPFGFFHNQGMNNFSDIPIENIDIF